jgi:glyoxylase-like metal-dependent hydrolase (beta-lactamase superfamily II)/predicted ester cyclase
MSTSEVARRYFAALDAHDLDSAVACWQPGAIDRFVGEREVVAPDGVREYFGELFAAFPDFSLQIVELTTAHSRTAVRWRGRGTFAGPGTFQGFEPNGARVEIEGCDVITARGELIEHNDAFVNTAEIVRQLGFLPPQGSPAERRLAKAANLRTRLRGALHGARVEQIAEGVWVVRGGVPRRMNVYLLADEGRITVFDAGIADMTDAVAAAGARLGGIDHVVLGHADADHRGAAPGLGVPVYCHELEREAAESDSSFRPYYDIEKLPAYARPAYRRLLPLWDGGPVSITTTVHEGDHIAGFTVIDLPGHAPGLIGLLRESDRVALCSDCIYTVDPTTGRKVPAGLPHSAFNFDETQARASIRKLAALNPSVVWAGHADPVTGDVVAQLERAAAA